MTKDIINEIVESAASLTDAQLKSRVYLTKPMRSLMRIEKTYMVNLYNSPIKFEAALIPNKTSKASFRVNHAFRAFPFPRLGVSWTNAARFFSDQTRIKYCIAPVTFPIDIVPSSVQCEALL